LALTLAPLLMSTRMYSAFVDNVVGTGIKLKRNLDPAEVWLPDDQAKAIRFKGTRGKY
jgi:hypothetical protein